MNAHMTPRAYKGVFAIDSRSMAAAMLLCFLCTAGCGWRPWGIGDKVQKGHASWYGNEYHGRRTASGEIFDENDLTAAHRKHPFGTIVEVKNLRNGKRVRVRINDRGPFQRGRIIDLSKAAARRIGMLQAGVVPVRVEVIKWGPH